MSTFTFALPETCPHCDARFEPFLRWSIYRSGFVPWFRRSFGAPMEFAVICRACKDIVGYEVATDGNGNPQATDAALRRLREYECRREIESLFRSSPPGDGRGSGTP